MTNPLNLPKTEDVKSFDLGNTTAHLVKITPENKDYLVKLALSMYIGMRCRYCQVEFVSLDELNDVVWASRPGEPAQIAHSECFSQHNCQTSVS